MINFFSYFHWWWWWWSSNIITIKYHSSNSKKKFLDMMRILFNLSERKKWCKFIPDYGPFKMISGARCFEYGCISNVSRKKNTGFCSFFSFRCLCFLFEYPGIFCLFEYCWILFLFRCTIPNTQTTRERGQMIITSMMMTFGIFFCCCFHLQIHDQNFKLD